jgi:hypothetical protein
MVRVPPSSVPPIRAPLTDDEFKRTANDLINQLNLLNELNGELKKYSPDNIPDGLVAQYMNTFKLIEHDQYLLYQMASPDQKLQLDKALNPYVDGVMAYQLSDGSWLSDKINSPSAVHEYLRNMMTKDQDYFNNTVMPWIDETASNVQKLIQS